MAGEIHSMALITDTMTHGDGVVGMTLGIMVIPLSTGAMVVAGEVFTLVTMGVIMVDTMGDMHIATGMAMPMVDLIAVATDTTVSLAPATDVARVATMIGPLIVQSMVEPWATRPALWRELATMIEAHEVSKAMTIVPPRGGTIAIPLARG